MLAELTHRCPLQCPYCSNPIELDRGASELTTDEWKKVLSELAEIGVLQIHFSGGEPTARKDLVELVQHATGVGLYSNLITSAVLLTTGENDPRVAPWQSRKFAAALQDATSSSQPILLLTRMNAGHGVGAPFSQRVGDTAIGLTFFAHELGLDVAR